MHINGPAIKDTNVAQQRSDYRVMLKYKKFLIQHIHKLLLYL